MNIGMADGLSAGGLAPYDLLSMHDIDRLQNEADRILEQIGLEVRGHPEARERYAAAGASVRGERVYFEAGLARALARASMPRRFVQRARDPIHDIDFGGGRTMAAPAAGPPMVRGRDGRRRYGTLADFEDFARLAQHFGAIDHAGGMYCEITDRDPSIRHLHALERTLRLTDKAVMGHARDPGQVRDSLDMARVVLGEDALDRACCLLNLFNLESPLVLAADTAEGMRLTAEAGEACLVTSYAILGMNAPVTCAGALALALAEMEAGVALTQLFRTGAPVMAGIYGAPFSMSAMRPAFGAVESMMLMNAGAQLARTLGCPVRGDGTVTSAKIPDAQAAADAARGATFAHIAGVDFALQSAGWLEGGLVMSLDKFVLDAAAIDMARHSLPDGCTGTRTATSEDGPVLDWVAALDAYERPAMEPGTSAALARFTAERERQRSAESAR